MKVILNKDLATLGEEGDVKDVAKGYARNYLFPREIALPYTERNIRLFEARKDEIEARKAEKRQDAAGIKEKLEALTPVITMPAGANGKLYGAVTAQTVAEELAKQGFHIERKKIELPGNTVKSVGRFKATVKLYENESAEINITVEGQQLKAETKSPAPPRGRRRFGRETEHSVEGAETGQRDGQGSASEQDPAEQSPASEQGPAEQSPAAEQGPADEASPAESEVQAEAPNPAAE
ncbi:MAG: 50S ribosomal protein L9 [Treponema sp.]|jgi:large subunit ribosomal protein L9|nr:50S ribosomal protein L9 [Treponema sp.]